MNVIFFFGKLIAKLAAAAVKESDHLTLKLIPHTKTQWLATPYELSKSPTRDLKLIVESFTIPWCHVAYSA